MYVDLYYGCPDSVAMLDDGHVSFCALEFSEKQRIRDSCIHQMH